MNVERPNVLHTHISFHCQALHICTRKKNCIKGEPTPYCSGVRRHTEGRADEDGKRIQSMSKTAPTIPSSTFRSTNHRDQGHPTKL